MSAHVAQSCPHNQRLLPKKHKKTKKKKITTVYSTFTGCKSEVEPARLAEKRLPTPLLLLLLLPYTPAPRGRVNRVYASAEIMRVMYMYVSVFYCLSQSPACIACTRVYFLSVSERVVTHRRLSAYSHMYVWSLENVQPLPGRVVLFVVLLFLSFYRRHE